MTCRAEFNFEDGQLLDRFYAGMDSFPSHCERVTKRLECGIADPDVAGQSSGRVSKSEERLLWRHSNNLADFRLR